MDNCQLIGSLEGIKLGASIEVLELSFNNLTSVPRVVSGLSNAVDIGLIKNEIIEIPMWLEEYLYETNAELNFAGNKIKTIPDFIWDYSCRIDISSNLFSEQ